MKPLLGQYSFLVFGIGIIGTGMLAVPVLACPAAYAVAELFRWHASLESKRELYAVLTIATLLGIALNNKRLVGEFVLPSYLRILVWTATAVMVCASLTLLGSPVVKSVFPC